MAKKAPAAPAEKPEPEAPEVPKYVLNPSVEPTIEATAPTKQTNKRGVKLKTHIIFEGEPKAPGDVVLVPANHVENWIGSGLAEEV